MPARRWSFVGPNGTANNCDDLAKNDDIVDDYYSPVGTTRFGPVEYPSPYKIYALYQQHPEYWTATDSDDAFNVTQNANNSLEITETVAAGYIRGDLNLFSNRLQLVGGARYERTVDDGYGTLNDLSATFQRDANGNLTNVKKPGTAADLRRLQYVERGAHAKRHYDGVYPSFNASFGITEQLIARFAYARTIARPDLDEIVPGLTIGDPNAANPLITVRNPDLKPWTADNYDLSLEYYFEPAGVLSAGVFRKNIRDFFGTVTTAATAESLTGYGLDDGYLGYSISSRQNVGDARVDGV
jgi:TonB-dependent receptor